MSYPAARDRHWILKVYINGSELNMTNCVTDAGSHLQDMSAPLYYDVFAHNLAVDLDPVLDGFLPWHVA